MSLGHMTPQEQIISLIGPLIAIAGAFLTADAYGKLAGGIVLMVCLALVYLLKAWCWSHTVYNGGFNNPKWSSEGKGLGKEDFTDE